MNGETGLLIFDDDPALTLPEKVKRACRRFRRKYRKEPVTCYVHPSAWTGKLIVGGVAVKPRRETAQGYFWIC